ERHLPTAVREPDGLDLIVDAADDIRRVAHEDDRDGVVDLGAVVIPVLERMREPGRLDLATREPLGHRRGLLAVLLWCIARAAARAHDDREKTDDRARRRRHHLRDARPMPARTPQEPRKPRSNVWRSTGRRSIATHRNVARVSL